MKHALGVLEEASEEFESFGMGFGLTPAIDALRKALVLVVKMDAYQASEWIHLGRALLAAFEVWRSRGKGPRNLGAPPYHIAAHAFKTALDIDSKTPDALIGMAKIEIQLNNNPEAERLLMRARDILPEYQDNLFRRFEIADVYFTLARKTTGGLSAAFLATSLKLGGSAIVTLTTERKEAFQQIVIDILDDVRTLTLATTRLDLTQIAEILEELEIDEMASRIKSLLLTW